MDTPLDNPAWSALTTLQASFSDGTINARRYKRGLLPFVGFAKPDPVAAADLDPLIHPGETFYIIGEMPPLPATWVLEMELPCAQLLAPADLRGMPQPQDEIVSLSEADKEEMYRLITSVQSGYYLPDTRQLGDYWGIREKGRRNAENGKLIAMAGERMRFTGYSELSAICTHPDHIGHGYAQQLIAWLCRKQAAAGITPFLHVALSNERALRLYIYLGFRHRREIVFRRIRKID